MTVDGTIAGTGSTVNLNLGGLDVVWVYGANATNLNINGVSGDQSNAVDLESSASSQSISATLTDAAPSGGGSTPSGTAFSGLGTTISSTVTLSNLEEAELYLPALSSSVTVNTSYSGIGLLSIQGGAGNDTVNVTDLGGLAAVDGGGGSNAVTVNLQGQDPKIAPVTKWSSSLSVANVATLTVDDTGYAGNVAWVASGGELTGDNQSIVSLDGANQVQIVGGTGSNTLSINETAAPVTATLGSNQVSVATGQVVLLPSFQNTYSDPGQAVNFNGLVNGSTTYVENGVKLTDSTGTLTRSDTAGPALSMSSSDTVIIQSSGGPGMDLSALDLSGSGATITIKGYVLDSSSTVTFTQPLTSQIATFKLPTSFNSLSEAVITTTAATLVDNIVVSLPVVTATPAPTAVASPTRSGSPLNVAFNTSANTVSVSTAVAELASYYNVTGIVDDGSAFGASTAWMPRAVPCRPTCSATSWSRTEPCFRSGPPAPITRSRTRADHPPEQYQPELPRVAGYRRQWQSDQSGIHDQVYRRHISTSDTELQ